MFLPRLLVLVPLAFALGAGSADALRSTDPPAGVAYAGTNLGCARFSDGYACFEWNHGGPVPSSVGFVITRDAVVVARAASNRTLVGVRTLPQPDASGPPPDLAAVNAQIPHANVDAVAGGWQRVANGQPFTDPALGITLVPNTLTPGNAPLLGGVVVGPTGAAIPNSFGALVAPISFSTFQFVPGVGQTNEVTDVQPPPPWASVERAIPPLEDAIAKEREALSHFGRNTEATDGALLESRADLARASTDIDAALARGDLTKLDAGLAAVDVKSAGNLDAQAIEEEHAKNRQALHRIGFALKDKKEAVRSLRDRSNALQYEFFHPG